MNPGFSEKYGHPLHTGVNRSLFLHSRLSPFRSAIFEQKTISHAKSIAWLDRYALVLIATISIAAIVLINQLGVTFFFQHLG
jgi:hypothetical protein